MTERLNAKPQPEVGKNQSQELRLTLKLGLNPNNTHYVDARNDDEVRAAMLALRGIPVKLPTPKK
jgi:hypothetical protein